MKPNKRREAILDYIQKSVIASPSAIANDFSVSVETVRRDLGYLKKEGLIETVHGGVAAVKQRGVETSYQTRATEHIPEKQKIASAAAELIKPGDSLILDGGTTLFELAKLLVNIKDLLVITPSVQIGLYLVANSSHRVFLPGGWLRKADQTLFGNRAVETVMNFRVDKAFVGAAGVSSEHGVTDYFDEEVNLRTAEIKSAQNTYLLVDHSKFNETALLFVAPVTAFSAVITNSSAPNIEIENMRELGVSVIVAE